MVKYTVVRRKRLIHAFSRLQTRMPDPPEMQNPRRVY
jgi:hypothetical protein